MADGPLPTSLISTCQASKYCPPAATRAGDVMKRETVETTTMIEFAMVGIELTRPTAAAATASWSEEAEACILIATSTTRVVSMPHQACSFRDFTDRCFLWWHVTGGFSIQWRSRTIRRSPQVIQRPSFQRPSLQMKPQNIQKYRSARCAHFDSPI
ncbi:hypothetical protein BCR34DRAFT_345567 [Clohesyomyces aquaticus]|uniref:Uncharacterized protein n=1 Tax=Clohesyomyces aquaticus TaxID=1231657 RepID=A0A1Y1ZK95_9PLEO|nr:hypothetical protein BCR34DRAFT_345567 [Clohesyomyces aquaticus]